MTYERQPVPEWAEMIAERDAEIERLRAALKRIDRMEAWYYEDSRDVLYGKIGIMRDIARAALTNNNFNTKENEHG